MFGDLLESFDKNGLAHDRRSLESAGLELETTKDSLTLSEPELESFRRVGPRAERNKLRNQNKDEAIFSEKWGLEGR